MATSPPSVHRFAVSAKREGKSREAGLLPSGSRREVLSSRLLEVGWLFFACSLTS